MFKKNYDTKVRQKMHIRKKRALKNDKRKFIYYTLPKDTRSLLMIGVLAPEQTKTFVCLLWGERRHKSPKR